MKVPNITGVVSSAARYFIQSSWQGRSVQVLCGAAFLALIFYVAFRPKKNPLSSEKPTTSKEEGVQKPHDNAGGKAAAENPPAAVTLPAGSTGADASATPPKRSGASHSSTPAISHEAVGDNGRAAAVKATAPATRSSDPVVAAVNAQPPEVKTAAEPASLKKDKFGEWLSKNMSDCEGWITKAKGDGLQSFASSRSVEYFIPKLKKKVEKRASILKPLVGKETWDAFFEDCKSIIGNCKAEPLTSCEKLKASLGKLQAWNARLEGQVLSDAAQGKTQATPDEKCNQNPQGKEGGTAASATAPKKSSVSQRNTPATPNKAGDNSRAAAGPDLLKDYPNEFGDWLVDKIEDCNEWITMGKGESAKQASCVLLLRRFIPELKEKVKKMIPVFKSYPEVKIYWATFFLECDAIADPKGDAAENSEELKTYLTKLKNWNDGLRSRTRAKFIQQIGDAAICPHYDFTDFQKHYFPYLGLINAGCFSRLLQAERPYLAQVGLREMEDVDLLQLRTMQPMIERLRQLACFFNITQNEEFIRPLIEEEIKKCTAVLKDSSSLIAVLKNSEDLEMNLQNLKALFGRLQGNLAKGLSILKEIEKNDIARQLIQLKGYIHQQDRLRKWDEINKTTTMTRLASYAQLVELRTLTAIYQMWDLEKAKK